MESEEKSTKEQKTEWVQRDLLDQIHEELKFREKSKTMATETQTSAVRISAPEVIALLRQGYTRYKSSDRGCGSIQEKYGLSLKQTRELFKDSRLANKRASRVGPSIEVTDSLAVTMGDIEEEAGGIPDRGEFGESKVDIFA